MFRTALLSLALAAGAAGPFAPPATADPVPSQSCVRFAVVCRYGPGPWQTYDRFDDRWEAERVADNFRYRGFDVVVTACR
jgi:hypothetical protein